MKTLKTIAIGALFSLSYLCSAAQEKIPINEPDYNKPKLFADLPQKMTIKVSDLESLFDLSVGTSVTARFATNFVLHGTIVSASGESESTVRSVVIKSTNRQGAVFTFTKITNTDGSLSYRGRILSKDNSDAYEIVKEDDQYVLLKKDYHELISE
jgi:hypothetical protein